MSKLSITNIEELRDIAEGEVVELPSFVDGRPFVARLRRPSLLGLATGGHIPNPLLSVAQELFDGNLSKRHGEQSFKDTADMLRIVAENALVDPAYAELEEIGLQLTDMQLLSIFNYSQLGVNALAGFRGKQPNTESSKLKPAL